MVIIWTEPSIADLQNFLDNARDGTYKSANDYIISLMNYVNLLKIYPHLGKIYRKLKLKNVRQLIYRKHKIFYTIYDNHILIITVIHSSRNMDNLFNDFLLNNY